MDEIKELKLKITELNNQIRVQNERSIRLHSTNKELADLYYNLKCKTEEEPEKLPMYKGDKERGEEIIQALRDAGGVNIYNFKGDDTNMYYIIGKDNIIQVVMTTTSIWLAEQLFELKELPPKKIELIEGEFYKCKNTPNDTCVFIYKNTNKYDTSYLCGIDIGRNFTESPTAHFSTIENIIPATEEQKEILLKRITKEGYIYNKKNVTLEKKKEVVEFSLKQRESFICRLDKSSKWGVDIYKEYNKDLIGSIQGYLHLYHQKFVIPLEGNEHLIGTKNNPDREYKFVKD